MKPLKDFISRIPESNYFVDYSDNMELVKAIEEYANQSKQTEKPELTGNAMLDELYQSELWKDIEQNFAGFDCIINDNDLRDFYKRLIWMMVSERSKQPGLNKKDLSVILNLLHFASDGWYVKETYDQDLFKSHTEQEKYVINLIKKINGSI